MRKGLTILFLWATSVGMAQPFLPENGHVYTSSEIPAVHITIDPDSLYTLYLEENWYSNHEYPAIFVFETQDQTDTIAPVGFRFRGNTARDKIKKSFKVSFNTFTQGGKYHGLEKLNLNAEVNDPAMMRSRLCWDLYRKVGVPAPRSNHVEVFINGEYYGLYLNTEHIDEEFCELRFGSQGGNLYKCSYPANLAYISDDPDDYKMAPWGDRTYELKTNTELDDYSDLAAFIAFLNLSSDNELECGFFDRFNVYSYLKVAAVDVLTGNWDGYIYNQNNFYLYQNPTTGRFEYIPYDTDNTWGIDWLDRNWSDRNIYTWSQTGAERPLFNRLMGIDAYRDVFTWHVSDILANSYHTPEHIEQIENLLDFIEASALADPYRPLDWGFSNDDFLNALYNNAGGHVDFGVLEFAEIRKNSALAQLEPIEISSIPAETIEDFEAFPEVFRLNLDVEGPECAQVNFLYSIDGVAQSSIIQSGSSASYVFEIPLPESFQTIEYNVIMTSTNGVTRNLYCNDREIHYQPQPDFVINEVMSSNDETITDEAGEFDDWIEIYNASQEVIDAGSYFLTDNSKSPTKWRFPDYSLQPGDFALVWADRDLHQGPLHANFRLDADGEEVYLFKLEEGGLTYMDGTAIPPLPSDFSFGRESDAGIPWVLFWAPTPGASNEGWLNTTERTGENFFIYPNPVSSILHFSQMSDYHISTIDGRPLYSGYGERVDVSRLSSGVYLIKLGDRVVRFVKN
jgi:spore coat protein CotH